MIVGTALHGAVEDDDFLKRGTNGNHAERHIVLQLLAHEDIAHAGIVDHIRHLRATARGIEGNGDSPHAIGAEVDIKALGLVLGEDGQIFLFAHAQ